MTVTVNKNVHNVHIWSPCTIFMQINNKIENIMKITTRKKECFFNYLNLSKITFKLNLRLYTGQFYEDTKFSNRVLIGIL